MNVKNYWKRGEPMVLAAGATLAVILFMTITLVAVILGNSLGYFWVKELVQYRLKDGTTIMGQLAGKEEHSLTNEKRIQLKVGNRDLYSQDFKWIDEKDIQSREIPRDAWLLERHEYGNFFGFLKEIKKPDGTTATADAATLSRLQADAMLQQKGLKEIRNEMSSLNHESESIRLKILKLQYRNADKNSAAVDALTEKKKKITEKFDALNEQLNSRRAEIRKSAAVFTDAAGTEKEIPLVEIMRLCQPNIMSIPAKSITYLAKIRELLFDDPRESNTEGGLFPAIFGTVMMVLLMSMFSMPFGVMQPYTCGSTQGKGSLCSWCVSPLTTLQVCPP